MAETIAPAAPDAHRLEDRSRDHLTRAGAILRDLERDSDDASLVSRLNDLHIELVNLTTECGIWTAMHPDKEVRDTAEALQREATELSQTALQNRRIYEGLAHADGTPVVRRFVELVRMDMRRAGVELGPAERDRARALRLQLTKLAQDHARNIRDDTRAIEVAPRDLSGLPDDYVRAHPPGERGMVRITTNPPDMQPFMTYAHNPEPRKRLHRESTERAAANVDVLRALTGARHELARLLGYRSWAHYNVEDRMVGTPQALASFIEDIDQVALASARTEFRELLAEKRVAEPRAASVGEWERLYLLNRVRAKRFAFDAQEVRPYFEYRAVRQAILDLNAELFGMTFTPVVHAERWHPTVETFDVTIDGQAAGRISLDMHPREGKNKWFFNSPLVLGVGGRQNPHSVLCCNFPDPTSLNGPALMEHQQVVTYFHEFGHLVHGLARGAVPYVRLSRTEADFMEAPSTFLEEWIYDHAVLSRFARHVATAAPIPEDLVARLRSGRDFGRGVRIRESLLRGARLALALHDGTRPGADPREIAHDIEGRYSLFEQLEGTAWPAAWEHMNSDAYSAGYYTYLWSSVIAKDLHTAFGSDLMDIHTARRYRDLILAPGGTKPAAELVRDFLGRPYDANAFKSWLAPRAEGLTSASKS